MLRLTLATQEETEQFQQAGTQSGLPRELDYLRKDPLAVANRQGLWQHDHVHLSVPDTNPSLVQWWGRGASGYHHAIGPVMKMVEE